MSTPENAMSTRRDKTLSLHLIFKENKMKDETIWFASQKIGAAVQIHTSNGKTSTEDLS